MYKKLNNFNDEITSLNNINSPKKNTKELKNEVLSNVRDLYNELSDIYKDKYNKEINNSDTKKREKLDYKKLRLKDNLYSSEEEQEEKQEGKQEEREEQEETISDVNKFNKWINKKETSINTELFTKYFIFQRPSDMSNFLNKMNDINKNSKPDKIVKIVEDILRFNKQKQGQGIKILTLNQMLSRLPISVAQLKAGNNSKKLKNEIRQLLYSLYRSKNMTKQVYNNLMKLI